VVFLSSINLKDVDVDVDVGISMANLMEDVHADDPTIYRAWKVFYH
jgi:hypothetical protein